MPRLSYVDPATALDDGQVLGDTLTGVAAGAVEGYD
jgi:hypothetical protein